MTETDSDDGRSPVICVIGPTATGKSDLAVALAQRIGAEIVNADAMQLYEAMNIGTAKLDEAHRGGINHYLLDIWPVTKSAAVAEYQLLARAAIDEIRARGGVAMLVGGSGLYVRAAVDELEFPGESLDVRARWLAELERVGPAALHAQLSILDPAAAVAILPSNGRRIVRALEVIELTGGPFIARMPAHESRYPTVHLGLDRPDLDDRVQQRTARMFHGGLIEEVRRLLPMGLRHGSTASKALGYAQVLAAIDDAGEFTGAVEELAEATARGTRRLVRRQRSWFRRDARIQWLDASNEHLIDEALARLPHTLIR